MAYIVEVLFILCQFSWQYDDNVYINITTPGPTDCCCTLFHEETKIDTLRKNRSHLKILIMYIFLAVVFSL
jgi:hypothetical protein